MKVTEETLRAVEVLRLTNLESEIVEVIGERLGVGPEEALRRYYSSEVCDLIERNEFGMQYLDARYLAEEILRN